MWIRGKFAQNNKITQKLPRIYVELYCNANEETGLSSISLDSLVFYWHKLIFGLIKKRNTKQSQIVTVN